jgi:pyridoxine 4-dehydrogenase
MISTQPARGVPAHRLDTDTPVTRIGYGAMQLAGPGVWGCPDDPGNAVAVLREAVTLGVNFLDTANAYGPRTVNQLIAAALYPYPGGLIIGNKVGATAARIAPGSPTTGPRRCAARCTTP